MTVTVSGQLVVGVNRHGRDFGIVMDVGVGVSNPLQWLLLGFGRSGFCRKGIGEVGEIWNWREEPPTWWQAATGIRWF